MPDMTKNADAIIVPVLPSDIDIHACSKCIADLLLIAKVRRDENRIGVVANRVRRNTVIYQSLMRFLETLRIPVIATLRDSQNYVRAAEQGWALHEMKRYVVEQDLAGLAADAGVVEGQGRARGASERRNQSAAGDRLTRRSALFFLFPRTANFFRPILVAVPVVEIVGDRTVAAAGLVRSRGATAPGLSTPGSVRGARRSTPLYRV